MYRDSVRCESERVILGLGNMFYLERRLGRAKTVTLMAGCIDHVVEFLL